MQPCLGCRSAVASIASFAYAGHCRDGPVDSNTPNTMVESVRDVDIAGAIRSQPLGHIELGQGGRAAVATETCRTCACKRGNPPSRRTSRTRLPSAM
jgi:hypothetical protein